MRFAMFLPDPETSLSASPLFGGIGNPTAAIAQQDIQDKHKHTLPPWGILA
jgi:hypothetical protein